MVDPTNGHFRYLHSDHLGSAVAATSWGGGVYNKQKYQAFGGWRGGHKTGFPSENRYIGQKLDTTGLMYYNARYYDPQIGHFISPDTIVPNPGNVLDYNRYMYVRGSPLKYSDPTGHTIDFPCIICTLEASYDSFAEATNDTVADLAAHAVCFVAGCYVDTEANRVSGPTEEEWTQDQANNLMGMGLVPMGSVTRVGARQGRRFIKGLDIFNGSQVTRRITNPLSNAYKRSLRAEARNIYDVVNPGIRQAGKLEIHHRIPLEWSHIFPDADPNRFANLIGLDKNIHRSINRRWTEFRMRFRDSIPTPQQVMEFAQEVDEEYSTLYQ